MKITIFLKFSYNGKIIRRKVLEPCMSGGYFVKDLRINRIYVSPNMILTKTTIEEFRSEAVA